MDRLIDEIVKVSVTGAIAAATSTSVNTVAVLGKASKGSAGTFRSQTGDDGIDTTFGADSELAKTAYAFWLENNPGKLVCIPSTADISSSNVETILDGAMEADLDFYHVVFRMPKKAEGTTAENAATAAKAIADKIEDWCLTNFRMGHVEIQEKDVAQALAVKCTAKAYSRTAIYFHTETDAKKCLATAIVADRCSSDPARGTWAHKTLASITGDVITKSDLANANEKGLNVYTKVAGVARTFFGSLGGSNNSFIDEVVKKDWLKFRTQEAIFNLLGSANNGDGVDYSDSGIAAIASSINSIFTIASDNGHRYVMPDSFEVQTPKYEDIATSEKQVRNLPDVKVPFTLQGSIHTVKNVELQVVA